MSNVAWESVPIRESNDSLVNLGGYDFILQPSYFDQGFSADKRIFLRKTVADKLLKIQKLVKVYKFKVWDGFRSREVQNNIYKNFWEELKSKNPEWDEERLKTETGIFVTEAVNPSRVPSHATGGAVYLTLVDVAGTELEMGTPFDHFGPESNPHYFDDPSRSRIVSRNRKILRDLMVAEDFCVDTDEWWHFDYGNQKWAVQLNRPLAIFGEAKTPS